jgi:hypothetical protein
MSAWIVDKAHIDLLVSAAKQFEMGEMLPVVGVTSDDQLGQMLVDECVKSVSYRYPGDDVGKGELPGPRDAYYLEPYRFEATRTFTATEIHRACACYDYQSCEHPGWDSSMACLFTATLRAAAEAVGYSDGEDIPWGFGEADVRAAAA